MIILKNKILHDEGKRATLYDVYHDGLSENKPVVIFCHGYKGFKDWGAWHLVAEEFAKAGFFFVKLNFSHNGGTLDQPIDFPDLEAFANNNFSLELDDLDRLINQLEENTLYNTIADLNNISLIGHSRGGGIVLIKASENSKIKKVITWASVSDFKIRFQEGSESFIQWKKEGIYYIENTRTKQQLPHYFQFYKDFELNEDRFNLKKTVQNIRVPQLIIHGDQDQTVMITEPKNLNKWNPDSKLIIIKGADHVFGSSHPWISDKLAKDLDIAVKWTIKFLKLTKSEYFLE
jgi:pimeloyl-ACP methyl ester carboxylesterase